MKQIEHYKAKNTFVLNYNREVLCECATEKDAEEVAYELNLIMSERIQYKRDLNNLKYRINQLVN